MIIFVLDASVILASLLSEKNPQADRIISDYLSHGSIAYVPALWHLEIRNILWNKEKRGEIPGGGMSQALKIIQDFSLITDHTGGRSDSMQTLEDLMKNYGLTSYDASYVELALRLNLPMATLDREIIKTCGELGVEIL